MPRRASLASTGRGRFDGPLALHAAGWVVSLGVITWLLTRSKIGDAGGWLYLINAFTPYLCLPVVCFFVIALITRRHHLWVPTLAAGLVSGLFIIQPLLPRGQVAATGQQVRLTAMTWNTLAYNDGPAGVTAVIVAADADVVALQELTPEVAAALVRDLAERYPYRLLDPRPDTSGLGILSRYPLRSARVDPQRDWQLNAQVATLTVGDQTMTVVNCHALPPQLKGFRWGTLEREAQIRAFLDWFVLQPGPAIVLGDLNATPDNDVYRLLTDHLTDAWAVAGLELGHTWPGGWHSPVPVWWLVRIDYVFVRGLSVEAAHLGPWDGAADHRAVIARVVID